MCWGDVKLKKTSTGVEFLEYGERQTKTRLGDDTNDVRPIAPKMFSLPNSDRCPVLTYKVFAEKRPTQMNFDEAPFYSSGKQHQDGLARQKAVVQTVSCLCEQTQFYYEGHVRKSRT